MLLFNAIWLASITFNWLSTPTVWSPSEYTYFIIFLFVIFVNIGFLVGIRLTTKREETGGSQFVLNRHLFYIINLVFVVVFFFQYTIPSIRITNQFGVFYTRYYAFVGSEQYFGSTLKLLFAQIVVYSFFFSTLIVGVYDMFEGRRNKKRFSFPFILGMGEMLLYSYTFKGRQPIILTLFFVIISYLVHFKWSGNEMKSFNDMNIKSRVRFAVVLLAFAVVILSISRFNGLSHIKKFLITYFGSQPTYLSELIKKSEIQMTPGRFTLCGLLDTIKLILNQVFHLNLTIGSNQIGLLIDGNTLIGPDITMNAGCTAIFYFYYEFGILGVIFCSFIFGTIATMLIKNSFKRNNIIGHIYLLLAFYTIYYTYSGWSMKYFYFWAAPLIVRAYYKKDYIQ